MKTQDCTVERFLGYNRCKDSIQVSILKWMKTYPVKSEFKKPRRRITFDPTGTEIAPDGRPYSDGPFARAFERGLGDSE